jgi:hypothetical protein
MTTLAAAEPLKEVSLEDRSEPTAPSASPASVRSAPHLRETSPAGVNEASVAEPPQWYGWQTLGFDGALLVGTIAAGELSRGGGAFEELAWVPAVAFLLGGPSIHLIHEEPWRALGSLGLRTGLPVLGGLFGRGFLASCPPPDGDYGSCGLGELAVGVATGMLAATLIDGFALARESPKPAQRLTLSLTPFVSSDGTAAELRIQGQF